MPLRIQSLMAGDSILIFLYNADHGLVNGLLDSAHKIISPNTYSCDLCKLTHGALTVRSHFKSWSNSLDAKPVFLHRDEVQDDPHLATIALPAVLAQSDEKPPRILLSDRQLAQIKSVEELTDAIDRARAQIS